MWTVGITRITVRGRCAKRSGRSQIVPIHEIQGYSVNLSHHSSNSIHVDPRILFCQQMFMICRQLINYFNSLGKSSVIDDFCKYLVFSTRSWTSSHVTWRHGSSEDQLLDFARGAGPGEVLTLTMNAVTNQLVISATQRSIRVAGRTTDTDCLYSVHLRFLDVCSDPRDGKTPIWDQD